MKHTLHLQSLPFASNVPFVELEDERILTHNIIFPGEDNPHHCQLWVIGNEYGALGAVWAYNEQDALDELCDADLAGGLLVDESEVASATDEERDEWANIGNAGEYADLTHCWMAVVSFDPARDIKLMLALAEARGAAQSTL